MDLKNIVKKSVKGWKFRVNITRKKQCFDGKGVYSYGTVTGNFEVSGNRQKAVRIGTRACGLRGAQGISENEEIPRNGGGYGRAYDVPPVTAEALAAETEKTFCARHIAVYGKRREIRRAASFCGAGADEDAVEFAVRQGADVLVSSDFKHHVLTLALESGLSVIQLTHYASENYGFEKYYRKIRRQAGIPCIFHTDEELL